MSHHWCELQSVFHMIHLFESRDVELTCAKGYHSAHRAVEWRTPQR